MEEDFPAPTIVDPEVRAYVYSLVSALGGTGADEDGRYVLGDDALACLKDIKRWLKLYDEKSNRLDVARCLAEANLVKGDLLEILAAWSEDAGEDKVQFKTALACLELLVPLTWPADKNEPQTTVNHHRHIPYLQLAQITYKREILEHPSSIILRTAVRIALPSIALPLTERGSRDEAIIRLLLYFIRNIVIISAPYNLPVEWNENEVSRSATIEALHKQDVLALLLTICSNVGEDFNTQDVVMIEILFHLLKGIDIVKLFMDETQLDIKNSRDLRGLIAEEAAMLRQYAKTAPSRHNRFGTMIWVKRDDERVSTVSGQDALSNSQHALSKMDQSKKWNRPKGRGKGTERTSNSFDLPVPLNTSATRLLRSFVEEFIDSGFNPLFSHVRRAIEREAERVLDIHSQYYFFLVSWFLEAERARRKSKNNHSDKGPKGSGVREPDNFGLVASVLNQETFILLNRYMQDRLDTKSWVELSAGMRAFSQILLMVQEMVESKAEEDQEIAENIQNRIFYEETTHDRIISIMKGYTNQGFYYLDACTQLSHVFLRLLERYSKENADLQIRSKRRAHKKKASIRVEETPDTIPDQDSEAEEAAEAVRVIKERSFDFARFSSRFITQGSVNTFVAFTSFYKDLSSEQLKRAHRMFHRIAFKQDLSVLLFRLDIIALFKKMVNGPEGLNTAAPTCKEWNEFTRQLFKKMIKKLQDRPELAVELLFSKINTTVFYLEYGYEKQTISRTPRAPAELEVKGAATKEEQIGIAVAVLHEENIVDSINFVIEVLASAASERRSWEAETVATRLSIEAAGEGIENSSLAPSILVKPDNDERRMSMFKNNKLRLLMTLVGFERMGIDDAPDTPWTIPSFLTSSILQDTHDLVKKHFENPITHYGVEDPMPVTEMLKRKSTVRRTVEFDDDSEGDDVIDVNDEEFLFPRGGPTTRKSAVDESKKKRRKTRVVHSGGEGEVDDGALAARRLARHLADLAKWRKIKSEEIVHSSDDEDNEERDREFFAKEADRRRKQSTRINEAIRSSDDGGMHTKRKRNTTDTRTGKRAKNSAVGSIESKDDGSGLDHSDSSATSSLEDDVNEDEVSDTPLSSPHEALQHDLQGKISVGHLSAPSFRAHTSLPTGDADEEDEVSQVTGIRRRKAAVLDDSDDD